MNKSLIFILGVLFIFCVSAFAVGALKNSNAAFVLSGAALLPFVGIFAVGVLDYKVGGNQLTLEKRINDVEVENKELKNAVTSLLEAIYVVARGSSGFGGMLPEHYELIEKYLQPINHQISRNSKDIVIKEVERLFDEHNKEISRIRRLEEQEDHST